MTQSIRLVLKQLREIKPQLKLTGTPKHSDQALQYFDFYQLNWPPEKHYFGYFSAGDYELAGHVFKANRPKGTVVYCHGYSDHIGSAKHLIRYLLDNHYNVATFDHIGHGMSLGEPGVVEDFADYVLGLEHFLYLCQQQIKGPYYLVGHSMGGAVSQEYLVRHKTMHTFKNVILLAPLIRLEGLALMQAKYTVLQYCIKKIPRNFTNNTSDKDFLKFQQKKDLLQLKEIPLDWMIAYNNWYKRIQCIGKNEHQPMTVIVGDKDATVDWTYTLRFIPKKFPQAELNVIEDAAHHLPGEGEPYQSQIFEAIGEALH